MKALLYLITLLSASVVGHADTSQRQASNLTLFVYGPKIGGFPLFFANNQAVIAPPGSSSTGDSNTTFALCNGTLAPSSANGAEPIPTSARLYIVNSTSSFDPIGFMSKAPLPPGAVTKGFFLYGTNLMLLDESGAMTSKFWAPIDGNSPVQLYWNGDSTKRDGFAPVTIRTARPNIIF